MGLGIKEIIGGKKEAIMELAKKYGIEDIRIFGSVVRGEATEKSDVDFLINAGNTDFFRMMDFRESAGILLGREIDVVSDRGLDKYIGPYILKEAIPL